MKQATLEWVRKAEEDYLAARALARKRKTPLHSAVCFHAQQSAEKYLKARLEEAALHIPKTHDLEALLLVVLPVEPLWFTLRAALQNLTDFAVDYRYPGATATSRDAKQALSDCNVLRKEARNALGLPP
jgi:HEPN domain-containing protein